MNKYEYPAEKFDNARKFLERSRSEDDVILIADAFRECRTALYDTQNARSGGGRTSLGRERGCIKRYYINLP